MPLARSRLEILQIRKLIQYVRQQDVVQIFKMIELGVPGLINYQGSYNHLIYESGVYYHGNEVWFLLRSRYWFQPFTRGSDFKFREYR